MRDQFYLHFDTMPRGTAQQKKYAVKNGRTIVYGSDSAKITKRVFLNALKPHAPKERSDKPIRLVVWFAFDTKNKKLWGKNVGDEAEFEYKTTRPDTDNIVKLFKDCMTTLGYWNDDSQIVDEHVIKTYAEKATILVRYEEIHDKFRIGEVFK